MSTKMSTKSSLNFTFWKFLEHSALLRLKMMMKMMQWNVTKRIVETCSFHDHSWPAKLAKLMTQFNLQLHMTYAKSINQVGEEERVRLEKYASFDTKMSYIHSEEIQQFSCHSDFTWNQFGWFRYIDQKLPFEPFLRFINFDFWKFHIENVKDFQKFKIKGWWNGQKPSEIWFHMAGKLLNFCTVSYNSLIIKTSFISIGKNVKMKQCNAITYKTGSESNKILQQVQFSVQG